MALRYCLAYPSAPVKYLILESTGPGFLSSEDRKKRRLADEELGQKILLNGLLGLLTFGLIFHFLNHKKLS